MNRHQLKIIVPVSMADVHLLEAWVNAFRAVGGAKGHPVEFHPTPNVTAAAKDAAQAIKNFSGSVELYTTSKDYPYGWPKAPNAHYGHVMRSLANRGNALPWLWCELDAPPRAPGWADSLINQYVLTGNAGAMGVIMPMVKFPDPKNRDNFHVDKQDLYMVGVGIYDPGYFHLLGGISDQLWKSNDAFDMDLRHYTKKSWRSTDLISTASRTINYRVEGEDIVFDDISGKPEYDKRAGIVPRGTLLHHGCKDESLARLIVAECGRPWQTIEEMLFNLASEVPKAAPAPTQPPPTQLPQSQRSPEPEVHSDKKLALAFANAKAQHPEPQPNGDTQDDADAPFAPPGDESLVTVEVLRKAISEAAKPMRVEGYAKQLGTTEGHLKALVKTPGCGVSIVGGVWMKLGT